MMNKKHTIKTCMMAAAMLALVPALTSCVEKETSHYEGVAAYIVKTVPVDGSYGSEENPLTFPTAFNEGTCPTDETCFNVKLGAYAVDIEGNFLSDYNDTVSISTEPGKLSTETVTFVNGVVGEWTRDAQGNPTSMSEGIDIGMRYVFGSARIWIEDNEQKLRVTMPNGKCNNDRVTENGVYCEPSLATGVSEEYTFEPQTIKLIQYNPEQLDGQSPINKEYGQIKAQKGHDLVVTNIVSTGFYMTDLGDSEYNSIFIFTYSQPGRVEIGDRVCEVSGGIAEFTGMTQLQFPSWGIQNKERSTAEDIDPAPEDGDSGIGTCIDKETGKERDCTQEELEAMNAIVDCSDVYYDRELTKEEKKAFAFIQPPEPLVISPELLLLYSADTKTSGTGIDGSTIKTNPIQTNALERLESSVVTIEDVRLSTEFVDCDDNGNSKIESNSEESDCRTECQSNSKRCTELSTLESYDQWKAWVISNDAEISVASSSLIANFDISEDCFSWTDSATQRKKMRCPERHLKRITGNFKQILPGCSGTAFCYASKWKPQMVMSVIEPRIKTDLIMDETFNAQALVEFNECIADTRVGGCRETCMEYAGACTCEAYKTYRAKYPASDATWPTECVSN